MAEHEENLCLKCPVRGDCCYLSGMIEGYNIIFDFQPCKHLDIKTGLCKVYNKRDKVEHCKSGDDIFNIGGLPEKCLLLKGKKEENMKVRVKEIAHMLTPAGIMTYNLMNNLPSAWEIYKKECV